MTSYLQVNFYGITRIRLAVGLIDPKNLELICAYIEVFLPPLYYFSQFFYKKG